MTTTIYSNHQNTLRAADDTITTPTEIHDNADRGATAYYYDGTHVAYDNLADLCDHHAIRMADVIQLPATDA